MVGVIKKDGGGERGGTRIETECVRQKNQEVYFPLTIKSKQCLSIS